MVKFLQFKGQQWRVYKGILEQQLIETIDLSKQEAKQLCKRYKCLLIRWIVDFVDGSQLWFVVQREFRDYRQLSSNTRSKLNRAKRRFRVKFDLDRSLIKEYGVKVRQKLLYERGQNLDFDKFQRWIESLPSQYKFIGIFEGEQLVGYVLVYDSGRQLHLREFTIPKQVNRRYGSYLFFFEVGRRYLQDFGYELINIGFRRLEHRTEVQEFVIQKFGYERLYVKMDFWMPWWVWLVWFVGKFICLLFRVKNLCAFVRMVDLMRKG